MSTKRNINAPVLDTTSVPDLSETAGSATGETDNATVGGGWGGTDDDTSTAPSDLEPLHGLAEKDPLESLLPEVPDNYVEDSDPQMQI